MEDYKSDREKSKKRTQTNIDLLKSNISSIEDNLNFTIGDLTMLDDDTLPNLNLEIENYDYIKEMGLIKDEARDTLNCLSALYIDDIIKTDKNINNIIKNDAIALSDIKFSLSCAKRGLISCMKQLDAGSNDPLMHQVVNSYQKEIRESNKMIYDLLNKMKEFYKSLKEELKTEEIKTQEKVEMTEEKKKDDLIIMSSHILNDTIDEFLINKSK